MTSIYERTRQRASNRSRKFFKNNGWAGVLIILLSFTAFTLSVHAQANVTLAWNPSSDPLVAGFNIYYGGASGVYTNKLSAGPATSLTISNLVIGATYYFAATTYSAAGAESALSGGVAYTVPVPPPTVQMAFTSPHQFVLNVTGLTGHIYDIMSTQDLKTWAVIGAVAAGAGGSFTFTDTNAASFSSRFYRILDTSP
jgi:hypothetical protein